MAENFGILYKRLNGISNLGPNTRFRMGGGPTSGWIGGQELAHFGSDFQDCSAAAKHLLSLSLGLGCRRESQGSGAYGSGASLA
jgi:hypothetical protein